MITLERALDYPIERSAINVLNKLIFQIKKAYVKSTDDKTYYEYGANIGVKIDHIYKRLRAHTFRFSPLKEIQKRTKKKIRKIYLSTWEDKLVETWLNDSLNRLLNPWFDKNSYAYRIQDLGLDSCQNNLAKVVLFCKYFAKRDISQFFYSIDQDLLMDKIATLVDKNDFLYSLIEQRVRFSYEANGAIHKSELGIPFGSAFACSLSNIFLTDIDKAMRQFKVYYFRYADDILIAGTDREEAARATECFDRMVAEHKLGLKESHKKDFSFDRATGDAFVTKFSHLGLEYLANGDIKFSVEKQRKFINFFKRELNRRKKLINQAKTLEEKLKIAIDGVNVVIKGRIRSAAIIDYYLKHVNDEVQLRQIDRLVAEMLISHVLDKRFRVKDFRVIPFKMLRQLGLPSFLHRNRLLRHGKLRVSFLSLHNELLFKRYCDTLTYRRQRIDHMRMARKIKKENWAVSSFGRAPALQAGGDRFDPGTVHQL